MREWQAWEKCPLFQECIFLPIWLQAQKALADIYDGYTFYDLVELHQRRLQEVAPEYSI
jgi:DNA-binding IscR family transcriptional regulator